MIELTEAEQKAAASGEAVRVRNEGQEFVVLRADIYDKLADYDDTPWTSAERHALAWEAGILAGWEEMSEYDDYPEKA